MTTAARSKFVPKLRLHKASGQGLVVLNGQTIYLGKYGEPQTEERYHQKLAEWLAAGRQLPVSPRQLTVKELLQRFLKHAQSYCRPHRQGDR
ncbi:MAG: hypothetical protein BIFFINMI_03314 [Phycisphaerae bacterium]|nr:hypothetical protein [Phycisphaerae bacterium]